MVFFLSPLFVCFGSWEKCKNYKPRRGRGRLTGPSRGGPLKCAAVQIHAGAVMIDQGGVRMRPVRVRSVWMRRMMVVALQQRIGRVRRRRILRIAVVVRRRRKRNTCRSVDPRSQCRAQVIYLFILITKLIIMSTQAHTYTHIHSCTKKT